MKIIIKNMCVFIVLLYNINISLCQKNMDCYLHFQDNPSDRFYISNSTFVASIDSCFCSKDTLFVILKSLVKIKVSCQESTIQIRDYKSDSIEYYHAFRKNKSKYKYSFSLLDCYSMKSISYIIIKNYYCIRYFKHKRRNLYIQVASEIFSDTKKF